MKLKVQQDSDTNINDLTNCKITGKYFESSDENNLKIKLNNSTDAGNNFCTKKHLKSSFSLGDIDDNIKTTLTNHNSSSCKVIGALKKDGTYENYM